MIKILGKNNTRFKNLKKISREKHKYKVRRVVDKQRKKFPVEFPFWARMKINKNRTTLVIDDEPTFNKNSKKLSNNFVHREATHSYKKDYEGIFPNPDSTDKKPMYLKRPRNHPQDLFKPHNKKMNIPSHLKERYSKNNKKR